MPEFQLGLEADSLRNKAVSRRLWLKAEVKPSGSAQERQEGQSGSKEALITHP